MFESCRGHQNQKYKSLTHMSESCRESEAFPSVAEFIQKHEEALNRCDMKGMFTVDLKTIETVKKILEGNKSQKFLEEIILNPPDYSAVKTGSRKIKIADIADYPQYHSQYLANRNQKIILSIGGPAACDQAVLASLIPAIRHRLDGIIYLTKNYAESNVNHSAKQSHARDGSALNANESLTGHALLRIFMMRKIFGIKPQDVLKAHYTKIDVKFTLNFKKLGVYFGNELNWLKQKLKRHNDQLNEHDINRLESVLSQEIMRVIEKEGGVEIDGGGKNPLALHLTFAKEAEEEMKHDIAEFGRVKIIPQKFSQEEVKKIFGCNTEITGVYAFHGDSYMKAEDHQNNRNFAEKKSVQWIEGEEVDRIFLIRGEDKKAKIAGVRTKNGKFQYCSKLHASCGYMVDYNFDKNSPSRFKSTSKIKNFLNKAEDFFSFEKPLTSKITTTTGVSINAVFKKTFTIKKMIETFGSIMPIAITNSHWTLIAENDDYVLMRITGGGNTGSEKYNPAYFLNIIANTKRIFGEDALIGILSTYGCPRALNALNSTEFDMIAEGAIISYGKGGTGNTKRHFEAATALMMLGFGEEIVEYFNQFKNREGEPLGDDIKKIYEITKGTKFFHDSRKRTNRRMGYSLTG